PRRGQGSATPSCSGRDLRDRRPTQRRSPDSSESPGHGTGVGQEAPTATVTTAAPARLPAGSNHASALSGLERISRTRAPSQHREPPTAPTKAPAPAPLHSSQRYMPGLDGLRAVAVFAVIA